MTFHLIPVSSGKALVGQRPTRGSRRRPTIARVRRQRRQLRVPAFPRLGPVSFGAGRAVAGTVFGVALGAVGLFGLVARFVGRCVAGSSDEVELPDLRKRIFALGAAGALAAAGIGMRVYWLEGPDVGRWRQIAARQHESSLTVHGARGTIYDGEGRTLATSVRTISIGVHPKEIPANEVERYVSALLPVVGGAPGDLRGKLRSGKPFLWLERDLPLETQEQLKPAALGAVVFIPEFRRSYPQGATAGAVLGRVGRDGLGLSGVEQSFERLLRAPTIQLPVRRDARGRLLQLVDYTADPVADLGDVWTKLSRQVLGLSDEAPLLHVNEAHAAAETDEHSRDGLVREEGRAVTLTIDSFLQDIVEQELARGRAESRANRTFGILLDPATGEILALAQSPGFDPNVEKTASADDLRNGIIQDAFEPGSTLKPLVLAAALDERVITPSTVLDGEGGTYTVGPHVIRDVHPQHVLGLRDILVRSSNICMAKIGQRLGKSRLGEILHRMGFGSTVKIELAGESRGIVRDPESWAEIDEATHAFGQGLSVTPIQMVQAYSALANDGLMSRPHLVRSSSEGAAAAPLVRVLTPASATLVADMLRGVIDDEHGTGQKAAVAGLTVRGKTGTAQKASADGRGYDPDKVLASFIGFTRGDDPALKRKLVFYVAVDEPGVQPRWGGAVAAPIFQRAMERIASHLMTAESRSEPAPDNHS